MIALITAEDERVLLKVARWTENHRNRRSTIRRFVTTEEQYLLLIRELERVEGQRLRAQTLHAEATLTLSEWLATLRHFRWLCAYCQAKPFQVMSHYRPLPAGGTTVSNCVPACYRCCRHREKEHDLVRTYLKGVRTDSVV